MDSDSELKLISLSYQLLSEEYIPWEERTSLVIQIFTLIRSMNLDLQPKPESELMSLVSEAFSVYSSTDLDSLPKSMSKLLHLFSNHTSLDNYFVDSEWEFMKLIDVTWTLRPRPDLLVLIHKISDYLKARRPKTESELISLIYDLMNTGVTRFARRYSDCIFRIIYAVRTMDLVSQPMSELMSLVTQTVSVFNSMDMDSEPEPLSELISLITQNLPDVDSLEHLTSLVERTLDLKPEPELVSLIYQILSLVVSLKWKPSLISLSPAVQLRFKKEKVYKEVIPRKFRQAPVEIKHPFHPKHYLLLVLRDGDTDGSTCYCCAKFPESVVYYCSACDFALKFSCANKPRVLSIDHPKWHEHELALFSRTTSLTCDVCALVDSTGPLYVCPPCGFVTHQRCLSLPRVIRISRHLHRISFIHSFDQGDWSCAVCRKKIDNDYGGYSCIKNGCSYAAHTKCATQRNVWDGKELEGVPEEIEDGLEPPFVRVSDGIIQHFSHEHHHLKLDENTGREYDDDKLCQACVTPIHYGNFYYCLQCDDFILHEKCANLSRKIYNPTHPHLLTLVTDDIDDVKETRKRLHVQLVPGGAVVSSMSVVMKDIDFKLHVECATISEPLDHASHRHPLFLTSKPGEQRRCGVCNDSRRPPTYAKSDETFNCIECDFALCFACATLPQKVRYTHDNHMLTLSYGEDTSTMIYWCEACEKRINPKERFYKCDEYCCVTLHVECLVESRLYMKPGIWWKYFGDLVIILKPNNGRMSRSFCKGCGNGKRCLHKFSFILWRR